MADNYDSSWVACFWEGSPDCIVTFFPECRCFMASLFTRLCAPPRMPETAAFRSVISPRPALSSESSSVRLLPPMLSLAANATPGFFRAGLRPCSEEALLFDSLSSMADSFGEAL